MFFKFRILKSEIEKIFFINKLENNKITLEILTATLVNIQPLMKKETNGWNH